MSRNLKVLGLALVAVLAFSAVAAAGASAVTHEIEVGKAPADLTGTQEEKHIFTAGPESVQCDKSHFYGTQATTTAASVTMHPEFVNNCQTGSGVGAVVTVPNNCNFIFDGDTTEAPNPEEEMAHVAIDCNHESPITVNVGGGLCVLDIGDTHGEAEVNQTLDGVRYYDVTDPDTGKEAITVEATVTDIKYIATGAFCAFAGIEAGTHDDGEYFGNVLLTGKEDKVNGAAVDVTLG